jgi:hypothetical protein
MEITKCQYIDALDIVEKYHQQVGIINIEKTSQKMIARRNRFNVFYTVL